MISYVNPFRFIINLFTGFSVYHIVFSVVSYRVVHSSFFLLSVIVSYIHRFVHVHAVIIYMYYMLYIAPVNNYELIKQQLLFNLEFC